MRKLLGFFLLMIVACAGLAQQARPTLYRGELYRGEQNARNEKYENPEQVILPTNKELVSRARSVYVESHTFYMKREHLESSLLGRKEFVAWEMQITARPDLADLLIQVKRVPFSNHFNYTVTDRRAKTIVMAGKVDSLAGTVYGLIADEIVHKMKEFRGDPLAKPKS
jgi:hypothetical protein